MTIQLFQRIRVWFQESGYGDQRRLRRRWSCWRSSLPFTFSSLFSSPVRVTIIACYTAVMMSSTLVKYSRMTTRNAFRILLTKNLLCYFHSDENKNEGTTQKTFKLKCKRLPDVHVRSRVGWARVVALNTFTLIRHSLVIVFDRVKFLDFYCRSI